MNKKTQRVVILSRNKLGWRTFARCLREASKDEHYVHRNVDLTNRSRTVSAFKAIKNRLFRIVFLRRLLEKLVQIRGETNISADLGKYLESEWPNTHYHWFGHFLFDADSIPKHLSFSVSVDCTRIQRLSEFPDTNKPVRSSTYNAIARHEKLIFTRAEFIHATSHWVADYICKKYGIPSDKVFVCYFPISQRNRFVRENRESANWLTFIGNDFHRKGGDFLLDQHQRYLKKSIQLHIVGVKKPTGRRYENVVWHGDVDNEYVHDTVLPNSRALVLPTTVDMTPIVCIEAAAHGIPCIVTDVGATHELVLHEETGYLMGVDRREMLEYIQLIFNDDSLYHKMSESCRNHFTNTLKSDETAAKILELCRN